MTIEDALFVEMPMSKRFEGATDEYMRGYGQAVADYADEILKMARAGGENGNSAERVTGETK